LRYFEVIKQGILKKIFLFLFIFIISGNISSQEFRLKIIGQNEKENKIIDSIGYVLKHKNAKLILDENNLLFEKLTKKGYVESQLVENFKLNDSTFYFKYNLGKKINYARIYIGIKSQENIAANYNIKNDTLTLQYEEIENFLNATLKKLETTGFSMAKVKLVNIQKTNESLSADLSITTEIKRQVNDIVINGYDKFPEGHKKNIIQ